MPSDFLTPESKKKKKKITNNYKLQETPEEHIYLPNKTGIFP